MRVFSMNFDKDSCCSALAKKAALEVEEECMEDGSAAVALPFRLCENRSMEVRRLKLITDSASSFHLEEASDTAAMADEDDDAGSVGPEPSVASDTSSLAGSLDDLSSFDVGFEVDVDAGKAFEIIAAPVFEELSVECDRVKETRVAAKSMFFKDWVPLWGSISICGKRPEMEDAVVAVPRFFDVPVRMLSGEGAGDGVVPGRISLPSHFFGVYDGHGGAQVANYCQERIHLALVDKLKDGDDGGGGDLQKQWERAFNDCFMKVDAEVGGKVSRACVGTSSEASDPVAPETVGSTAVVSVICSSHIIVANCGDSRAVLCRGKQAVPLSVDHKPNREDEYARIEAAGGKVIQWNGYRVFGVLAMSRSIGDRYLKPWIIPEPEVRIISRMKDDECVILASDGLWDVMSNEEVCEAARKRLLLWHKKNVVSDPSQRGLGPDPASQAAAEYLSKLALQKGSKDNITVIVIDLKSQRKFKPKN